MNCGQNGRSHPITWLNLMNFGQNGRCPLHHLTKLDELWAERPFPPPHRLAKLDELWAERPFPPHHLAKLDERGKNCRFYPIT
ncbi:MAG: hypothetical protein KBE23_05405 [Chloroflexi bacterium]|nr:hypothetical protein [Chloroflexota bacterium]MBP7042157.1 hypothetical protein [Chloroflexota bacterium]